MVWLWEHSVITWPSERGGVAMTMVLQPAIWAGTAIMSVLLGSTAVPPGTYKPTAPAQPRIQLLTVCVRL